MRPIELTPRLRAIADLVPQGARFADVGTDHARLPIYLLQRGIIANAVASDLRQGPLDRAWHNAQHYNLADKISIRLSNGLDCILPDEVDAIVIAGMGGETIATILEAAPWVTQSDGLTLILQPMSAIPELRHFLQFHQYCIKRDLLCSEGETLYTILVVCPGKMPQLSPAELWIGRGEDGQDPKLRRKQLQLLLHRTERALIGIRRSTDPSDVVRCKELEAVFEELGYMLKECVTCQLL